MLKLIEALTNAQIPVPDRNTETFRMVRWGKNNRYWLKKFEGGYVFGDFVSGISDHIFDKTYRGELLKAVKIRMKQALAESKKEQELMHKNASGRAIDIWNKASPTAEHPYLSKKQVLSHGLRQYQNTLVIPLADISGNIWSLQFIDNEGNKRFLSDGRKKGCYFVFMIPVSRKIDTKKVKAVTGERLSFVNAEELAIETGYEQGGCSPVATLKRLPVFFDQSAANFDKIIFGAGENSYHVEVALEELKKAIDFQLADIAGDIQEE